MSFLSTNHVIQAIAWCTIYNGTNISIYFLTSTQNLKIIFFEFKRRNEWVFFFYSKPPKEKFKRLFRFNTLFFFLQTYGCNTTPGSFCGTGTGESVEVEIAYKGKSPPGSSNYFTLKISLYYRSCKNTFINQKCILHACSWQRIHFYKGKCFIILCKLLECRSMVD